MKQFALVTKTYRGDLALFADLCRSIDRHMPGQRHYVLVDAADAELFAPYASEHRKVIDCSELLPQLSEFNFPGRRFWWRAPFGFIRGWIQQQLAKIAFVAQMEEDAAVHLDSDLYLMAPITLEYVFADEKPRLYRNPGGGRSPHHQRWHLIAQRVLGLPELGYQGYDYIGQGVVWSPALVRAMVARIEAVSGQAWFDALAKQFRFSEYLLYGIFAEQCSGPHRKLIEPDERQHWHCSWHYDLDSADGFDGFLYGVQSHHIGALIQSNLGMPMIQRKAALRLIERHRKLSRIEA